jgi:hypothetical protein
MRLANCILSEVILFFLAHPFAPAAFCAAVAGGLISADVVARLSRRGAKR